MKLVIVALLILAAAGIQSCGVNDATSDSVPSVRTHFFPQENGMVYTYSRYANDTYDTVACSLHVGQRNSTSNELVYQTSAGTSHILYSFNYTTDASGDVVAELSTDSVNLLALEGNLATGATWMADPVHQITASVVGHYDEYYLPGRSIHFADVIAVKYHEAGQPDDVYTLRFFARGTGLIFERIVNANTEIASLQVLTVAYPTNTGAITERHHELPQFILPADTTDPEK